MGDFARGALVLAVGARAAGFAAGFVFTWAGAVVLVGAFAFAAAGFRIAGFFAAGFGVAFRDGAGLAADFAFTGLAAVFVPAGLLFATGFFFAADFFFDFAIRSTFLRAAQAASSSR